MALIQVRNGLYTINNREIPVTWGSYNFTDEVAGIPDQAVRTTLVQTGVMYVPSAEPSIRVSHLLRPSVQGLSALHEELCMNQQAAACPEVEGMVVDSIGDLDLQAEFIAVRLRMFGALCLMDESNEQFAASKVLLEQRRDS